MTKLEELVYLAIGQASMCWSETPKGVFDDVQAKQISEKLIKDICENTDARSWIYVEEADKINKIEFSKDVMLPVNWKVTGVDEHDRNLYSAE